MPQTDRTSIAGEPDLETIVIPVSDDMMAAAETLRRRLTAAQYNALFEAIVDIEGVELTGADFGIVDADPATREGRPNGGGPHPM